MKTGKAATSAAAGIVDGKPLLAHNKSKAAARKAAYMLEETVGPARPSRKSTRRSANKVKPDHMLWAKQMLTKGAPSERARRGR